MRKLFNTNQILAAIIVISFIVKVVLIVVYKNRLTLFSDDLNYIKSAIMLVKRGIYVYHNLNEPTLFVTPFYPFFLAFVFKVFGYGLLGLQSVRIIQAIMSCITIYLVFAISKQLINQKVGLIAALLVAFYMPNITTVGYFLTETIFTMLLCLLIYLSLKYVSNLSYFKFAILGFLWAISTLCRPTVAFYPLILFAYIFFQRQIRFTRMLRLGSMMLLVFVLFLTPWWVRNFNEYGIFVPLAASSGNPMLQGTYINYAQTPDKVVYYKLGKNAFETNKIETEVAKKRIIDELKNNFIVYTLWFTVGKTLYFWGSTFYWKMFFGISYYKVLIYHYILLFGFAGMVILLRKNFFKFMLPVMVIFYFNAVHCVYMAFDRYAFPLMPIMTIFCAYFLMLLYERNKSISESA